MSSLTYRPDIDGLRAVAVIPVVLFHLGWSSISGGFLGVDVFFVISGFLITSIITAELSSGNFSFVKFWNRRVRRIAPTLLSMVLVVMVVALTMGFRPMIEGVAYDSLAAVFSYANIAYLLQEGDYWGRAAEASPLLHTWSLSVEEQFYLFYPGFLFLLWRTNKSIIRPLVVAVVCGFVVFLAAFIYKPTFCFYMLPTRAWELGVGCIAALLTRGQTVAEDKKSLPYLSVAGLIAIVSSYFVADGRNGLVLTIIPVLGAFLIILNVSANSIATRALSLKPMVLVGKISYSLYVWHWPVIVFGKELSISSDTFFSKTVSLVILVVVAILSYYFIESPTRRMKRVNYLVAGLLFCVLILVLLGISLKLPKYDVSKYDPVQSYGLYYDVTPTISKESEAEQRKREGIIAPRREEKFKEVYKGSGIPGGSRSSDVDIMVIGDSHGSMWSKTIDQAAEERGLNVAFFTAVGNFRYFPIPVLKGGRGEKGFTDEQKYEFQTNILSKIASWRPKIVLLVSRWDGMSDHNIDNAYSLIRYCDSLSVPVKIFEQPPIVDIGDNNSAQYFAFKGIIAGDLDSQYIRIVDDEKVQSRNLKIQGLCRSVSSCSVFDVRKRFIRGDKGLVLIGRKVIYYDDDHLSYQGTSLLQPELVKIFEVFQK